MAVIESGATQFFRDPGVFDFLARRVLPGILAAKSVDEGLRIWVPGCAFGEEAYSFAILVCELTEGLVPSRSVRVFATDLDAKTIAEARRGRYSAAIAEAVTPARLARYFVRENGVFQVARRVREMCIFYEHDLLRDPPSPAIDLISCRNLDPELQQRLIPVFHAALRTGGYVVGSSEALADGERFATVDERFGVFRRVDAPPAETDRERLLAELHTAHERLSAELDAMNRIVKIGALFLHEGNVTPVLDEIVDAAMAVSGADYGNIQVLDGESGHLEIVAHHNFPSWWLDYWRGVVTNEGSCGTALGRGARVIVEDVERDPVFAGTPGLEAQRKIGIRSCQSTPLMGRAGKPIGMLSTHYKTLGRPSERALRFLDLLARQAADILERAQAQDALRMSEQRLRALVEASSEMLFRMSPDWSELRELHGGGFLTETPSTSTWLERYIHPDDQPQVRRAIEDAIRNKSTFALEHRVLRADNTLGWMMSRAIPVMDNGGNIVEWFGAASDITDRKRAEIALAELNRQLVAADRRKDEFLAALSHELRNPLAPIHSGLEVMDQLAPGSEEAASVLAMVRRQVRHLIRLIEDLLDTTRITRGKVSLQREVLDLDELVRHSVADYREAFAAATVDVTIASPPQPVWVNGDRTRLAQIVGNLLQNAAKFTPSGGTATVTIAANPARGLAELTVRDTGVGIAPEVLPHLFEPFVQSPMPLDRQAGGLGLGLAIVRGLVEAHGGSVNAASDGPGKGATFTASLPLERTPPAFAPEPAAPAASRRVLVIEDNVDAADTLRTLLELHGFEVEVAHDGREGVDRARGSRADVIVCDIGLPGMDGYEVARTIRATPELHDVTLVALSGYGRPEDVEMARQAGFDRHVTKPVDVFALERVLASPR